MVIINDRCPWCGEKIYGVHTESKVIHKPKGYPVGKFLYLCNNCGNWYKYGASVAAFWYGMAFFIGAVLIFMYKGAGILLGIVLCLPLVPLTYKIPKEKYPAGAWNSAPDLPPCKVKIEWDKDVFMLNQRIWSGQILPVCFVDKDDTPQSLMWCVKLDISKRRKNEADALMCFIKEEAPRELFKAGNRFFVFYDERKIGQGVVTNVI